MIRTDGVSLTLIMDRKHFLSSLTGAAAVPFLPGRAMQHRFSGENAADVYTKPPYLKPGAVIGITCPAGFMMPQELQPAVETITGWGFNIRLGNTVGRRDFSFGGTDSERLADLQQMLDDPSIHAILCARGGYGAVHLVDKLDFTKFVARPKWIVGFSDVTVLHSHISRNFRIATIHSKMCNSFPDSSQKVEPGQIESIVSIRHALTGKTIDYPVLPDPANRAGTGEGILTGGNLKTLESLAGSRSDIQTAGKILFLEDTGEYLYSIDRMFYGLRRTGKLERLAGLLIGGFKIKQDDPGDEFGRSIYNIVQEQVRDFNYPVCFNFPVGHQKSNFALKCGVNYRLSVTAREALLTETEI
jgi:muramoyltetrapeptide carboxypeptidase